MVAGAIFLLVPYRIGHFAHLELQWACFVPLAFWAVHRALEAGSFRHGVLAGILVWLQLVACVYYGVYLGIATAVLVLLLLLVMPGRHPRAIGGLLAGASVAGMLAYVSAQPYLEKARTVGLRDIGDISTFSAVPRSYFSAPAENWLWGWTSGAFTGDELRLMPGLVAVGLAAMGLFHAPRRIALTYGVLVAFLVDMSLGVGGLFYPVFQAQVFVLQGLRAPARISILAFCGMALLAGFGVRALHARRAFGSVSAVAVCLVALCVEYGSAPLTLMAVSSQRSPVYTMLGRLPRGVVAELPMPPRHHGAQHNPFYMLSSINHWYPLVNGYSGFIPAHYTDTLDLMEDFPDDRSIKRLRGIGTRYVIVHERGYTRRAVRRHPDSPASARRYHPVRPVQGHRSCGGPVRAETMSGRTRPARGAADSRLRPSTAAELASRAKSGRSRARLWPVVAPP